jgi:tRNA dimethylallyltransferase
MSLPRILAIVGPTAGGKTALSLALARALDGEVICCDSMQIYRGMDIGTAKPTPEEMAGIPHHLLDVADPADAFSVNDYVVRAQAAVQDILSRGKLPVFCGGTGLYLDAFLRGGLPETPPADPALRERLNAEADENGEEALHARLAAVDPESAETVHKNNRRRVIRALEIFELTGVPKSEWDRRSNTVPMRYNAAVLGLRFSNRALLNARIAQRVEQMLEDGLLQETKALADAGVFESSPTAAAAIGYKELLPFLRGECELAAATEELKTATRRYAKRQMTWFGAKPYVHWIEACDGDRVRKSEEIVNNALELSESVWHMI